MYSSSIYSVILPLRTLSALKTLINAHMLYVQNYYGMHAKPFLMQF